MLDFDTFTRLRQSEKILIFILHFKDFKFYILFSIFLILKLTIWSDNSELSGSAYLI